MAHTLEVTTPDDHAILMTRAFDAPRDMVFEAWTRPEWLRRWLGVFGGWSMEHCEVDLRDGGEYRYAWRGPGGASLAVAGLFREIVPPIRIVCTEHFDDPWYEGEAVSTLVLQEAGGVTSSANTVRYASKAARDAVLQTGMARGVAASYDALDAVLASMTRG